MVYFNKYYVKDTRNEAVRNLRLLVLQKYTLLYNKDLEIINESTDLVDFQLKKENFRIALNSYEEFVRGTGVEKRIFYKKLIQAVEFTFEEGGGEARPSAEEFYVRTKGYLNIPMLIVQATFKLFTKRNAITLLEYRLYMKTIIEKKVKSLGLQELMDEQECLHFADILVTMSRLVGIGCLQEDGNDRDKMLVQLSPSLEPYLPCFDIHFRDVPMLCPPKDWFLDSKGKIRGGGFLTNETYEVVRYGRDRSHEVKLSQDALDNINYLQSIPFQIDRVFLKEIRHDFNYFLDQRGFKIQRSRGLIDFMMERDVSKHAYYDQYFKIMNIIDMVEQATYLSHFDSFWFPVYICPRGRIQYEGWPLNPQKGCSISQRLLKFEGIHRQNSRVELLPSAPYLQTLALLTCNTKHLKGTNVMIPRQSTCEEPKIIDLYGNLFLEYKSFISSRVPKWLSNRDLFEEIVTGHLHKESFLALVRRLKNSLKKRKKEEEFDKIYKEAYRLRLFLKTRFQIINDISSIINEVIRHCAKERKAIRLDYDSNVVYNQFYTYKIPVKHFYQDYNNCKVVFTLNEEMRPYSVDIRKTKKTLLRNILHYADAIIMHKVVSIFREKGIPLVVLYPSFQIHKKHGPRLKKIYYQCLLEIFLKKGKDSFFEIFLQNNVGSDKFLQSNDRIQKMKGSRKKLKMSKYKISPFILY